jgi:hypothetical protein
MRIPQSYVQKCKVVAHIFQAIFIFIALCITIAVFTMSGRTGGATKFYLALVGPLATALASWGGRLAEWKLTTSP